MFTKIWIVLKRKKTKNKNTIKTTHQKEKNLKIII